jgi:hypothetical protein
LLLTRALSRARLGIWTIALTYALSLGVGLGMVHAGNHWALSYRDALVARALRSDPTAIAYSEGRRVRAAGLDFVRNLFLGAIPQTLGGLIVVLPYPTAAYRGWVGGIVSVGRNHVSRLRQLRSALYYIITLLLQLIPYTLSGGAGVNLGLAYFRPPPYYRGRRWLGVPVEALRDAVRIYSLIVPLMLIASMWEFLSPWG